MAKAMGPQVVVALIAPSARAFTATPDREVSGQDIAAGNWYESPAFARARRASLPQHQGRAAWRSSWTPWAVAAAGQRCPPPVGESSGCSAVVPLVQVMRGWL